jgi:hypothetical protein
MEPFGSNTVCHGSETAAHCTLHTAHAARSTGPHRLQPAVHRCMGNGCIGWCCWLLADLLIAARWSRGTAEQQRGSGRRRWQQAEPERSPDHTDVKLRVHPRPHGRLPPLELAAERRPSLVVAAAAAAAAAAAPQPPPQPAVATMRRLTAVLRHRKKKGGSNSLAELTRKTEEKLGLNLGDFASQLTPAQQASLRERKLNFPNLKENGTGLSLCTYFSYCAPSLSTVPIQMLIAAYIFTFYERVGAELPTLAFFQALKGGLEVLSDPAMSYCTDSCRSTHGRRRPFLMWGCIPYAVSLIMLLTPPPWFSGGAASIWFGATYIIFSLCSTATILPYDALAPEVTDHPASRSRLFFTCTVFDGIGSLCACTLPIGINTAITWWRTADFSSCDVPDAATGTISVSSCSGYLSDSLSSRRWTMCVQANTYRYLSARSLRVERAGWGGAVG